MARALCLLHANCQGNELRQILEATPSFSRYFRIRLLCNYLRETPSSIDLEQCALFLYQPLGEHWGNLSSAALLEHLPQKAITIPLPNLFFKGYWPFWEHSTVINFQDSLLENLLRVGDDDAVIRQLYLYGGLVEKASLDAIAEASLQEAAQRERDIPIKTAAFIREHWREQQLFLTINHPAPCLLSRVVENVLRLLHIDAHPPCMPPLYNNFHLPIHPQVARHFSLHWIEEHQRYPVFGRMLTFADYVSTYIACRRQGIQDFVKMLDMMGQTASHA